MKDKFFTFLQKKLSSPPPKSMDEAFWRKFDSQFPQSQPSFWGAQDATFFLGFTKAQLSGLCSLVLVGFLFTQIGTKQINKNNQFAAAAAQEQELLENMELIQFMTENNLTNEEMETLLKQEINTNYEG